jgi:acetyl-CoA decarbonylase/synthase complex subunit delta
MVEHGKGAKKKKKQQEFGEYRLPGTAGPNADFIVRTLDRWKLRGDGTLK